MAAMTAVSLQFLLSNPVSPTGLFSTALIHLVIREMYTMSESTEASILQAYMGPSVGPVTEKLLDRISKLTR